MTTPKLVDARKGLCRRPLLFPVLLTYALLGLLAAQPLSASAATHAARRVILLGNSGIASQPDSEAAGHSEAFPFKAGRSGAATRLSVYVSGANTAREIRAGLYSNIAGHPGRLLSSGSLRHVAAARWNTFSIRRAGIHAGGGYWIALLGAGGALAFRDLQSHTCNSQESAQAGLRDFPANWRPGRSWSTCELSAYVSGPLASKPKPKHPKKPKPRAPKPPKPPAHPVTPPAPVPPPGGRSNNCFPAPGACGFPDPAYHTAGATSACSSLPSSGSINVSTPGETVQNRNVHGTIIITAPNVRITNVCVTTDGGGQLGSLAVDVQDGANNTVIDHTTVAGADTSGRSIDMAVRNASGQPATLSHDYLYNCGECVHDEPWTVNDSYVIADGMVSNGDEHYEAVYCSDGTISLNHDTLLNPEAQVAVVFCDTNGGSGGACRNHLTIANSLMGGGGFMLYPCGNASSVGSSTMNISGNRFARCSTGPLRYNASLGGTTCRGDPGLGGADSHGYFPRGGYYGDDIEIFCPPIGGQRWANNVWDDTSAIDGC